MSDARSRSRDTIDIEMDPTSRNVRPRHSPIPGDPYLGGPSNVHEQSDSEEEPFEEEEASPSAHSSIPSPLPPTSPPSPIAPPPPTAPPSPVCPSLRFSSRNEGTFLRWDWMPTSLRWWRLAERLPVIPIPAIPRDDTPIPTLTQEPVHHTIPVVVARLRTHDEQLEDVERALEVSTHKVEDLQHQVTGVESELSELRDEVVTTHTRGGEALEEIAALRQEVATLRQELAEMRAEREQFRADAASSA